MPRLSFLTMAAASMVMAGCEKSSGSSNTNGFTNANTNTSIDPTCNLARTTTYTADDRGWCRFDRTSPILPEFVRDGLTFAIAEPWNMGSYGGEPGEACGECWEISNSWAQVTVMVHDLCPIQGNPVCAGDFLHFDLSSETDDAIGSNGSGAIAARPVPCPVTGNIHVDIGDWNEWGYHKLAFFNHRIPVRHAFVRAFPDGDWMPLERDSGGFLIHDGPEPADGEGVAYRIESAQGQEVTGTNVLPFTTVQPGGDRLVHDIGVQFDDQRPPEGVCEYTPPGVVYDDDWGGIPGLNWMPNPWGATDVSESSEGCHNGSASCLRVDNMIQGSGFHIYIWQSFPVDSFASLKLWARTLDGTMEFVVSPSNEDGRCGDNQALATTEWTEITVDVASLCAAEQVLSSVTFAHGEAKTLMLDDIRFE